MQKSILDPGTFTLPGTNDSSYKELVHWQSFFFTFLRSHVKDPQACTLLAIYDDMSGPNKSKFGKSFDALEAMLKFATQHHLCDI